MAPTLPDVDEVAADYAAIVQRRIFSNGGPVEKRFAKEIGRWVGRDTSASLVSSATAGIQLAINTTFRTDKTYALVASFTFAAGPLAIHSCGYKPAFLDVDPGTWHASLKDAMSFLGENKGPVAGILLTNTFGVANDEIQAWELLADQYDLPLVVDSAAGFGSQYASGERLGARGTCEVFSFHATKTLAIGEGGAVTARDPDLIERINRTKNFGFDSARRAVDFGTNAKLTELSCAIGLRQLAALPDRLATRRQILALYRQGLNSLGAVFQPSSDLSAVPFVSALLPSREVRDATLAALEAAHVEARAYYNPPVHQQPVFADAIQASPTLSVTVDMASRIISLPMNDNLTVAAVARIVDACRAARQGLSDSLPVA